MSSDRDEESWQEYLSSMPWYSVPFGDDRKKTLSRKFDVSGKREREGGRKREREIYPISPLQASQLSSLLTIKEKQSPRMVAQPSLSTQMERYMDIIIL